MEHTLRVSKTVAKTRRERLLYLSPQTAKAVATFIRMKPEEWENIKKEMYITMKWVSPTDLPE